jgi:hypothetical protein
MPKRRTLRFLYIIQHNIGSLQEVQLQSNFVLDIHVQYIHVFQIDSQATTKLRNTPLLLEVVVSLNFTGLNFTFRTQT